ncbi:MAG: DUF748 domain-containing protein, partial [Gemmatimonadales bacterium]
MVLDEFRVVRPRIVARIASDGRPAVADLMEPDSAVERDTTARPPRLVIQRLAVREGQLDFVDESRTPRYQERLRDLGLSMEGLSTLPEETGEHILTATFAGGARVRWSGSSTVQPLSLTGSFEISNVPLARMADALGGDRPLRLTSGKGEGRLPYEVNQGPGGRLVLSVPGAAFTATDLAVQPRGPAEDWVRVPRLELEGIEAEWPAREARIGLVRVSEPFLAAERLADGTVNWSAPLAELRPATASEIPTDSASPWSIVVRQFEVAGVTVRVTDRSVSPSAEFEVTALEFRAGPLGTDSTVPTAVAFSAATGRGAKVSGEGQLVRTPLAGQFDIEVEGLDLRRLGPYFGPNPPATIEGGRVAAAGRLRVSEGRPSTSFDGRAAVTGFFLADSAGDSLMAWRAMRFERVRFTQAPDLLRVERVAIERPFARIAIARDRTVNLMALTTMLPASAPEDRTPYEIGEIAIRDARVDFSDESLILPFRTLIDSGQGSIPDVASFGGTPGSLEFEGKIEEYGLARASGTLHLSDPFVATDIQANFLNVNMASLTPYSAEFAGYTITKGRLDVDVAYSILQRQLEAEHKIVMTDLQLGDKVEGGQAPGFLVKLAVSLLKDDQGRIQMDIPVEGSVDNPQFDYGAVVWGAIKTILVRVATAPFRFLGNLLGIGGEDVELVDFDPGRSDVIPPEREKLDSLAAEMGRKPELLLTIEGRYDSLADAEAIREAGLLARVSAQRDSMGKKAQSDTSATMMAQILERLYAEQFSKAGLDSLKDGFRQKWEADTARGEGKYDPATYYAEVRKRLLEAQPVEPGELERIGAERGAAIAAALTEGGRLDAARVTVAEATPVSKKKKGSTRVASEMTLDAK